MSYRYEIISPYYNNSIELEEELWPIVNKILDEHDFNKYRFNPIHEEYKLDTIKNSKHKSIIEIWYDYSIMSTVAMVLNDSYFMYLATLGKSSKYDKNLDEYNLSSKLFYDNNIKRIVSKLNNCVLKPNKSFSFFVKDEIIGDATYLDEFVNIELNNGSFRIYKNTEVSIESNIKVYLNND